MTLSFSRVWAATAFAAMIASGLVTSVAQAQGVKIAFVNSQKILAEAPGRAEAEATYEKEVGTVRQQLQHMDDSLKVLATAFEKDAPKLDSVKRETRGKFVQEREAKFQQRAQELDQQMRQRQADLVRPLMEQVQKVLEEIRAQGNYSMIFDVASQASVIVAADKNLEITDQVLARLKALGPPKASTTAPAAPVGPSPKPSGVTRPR